MPDNSTTDQRTYAYRGLIERGFSPVHAAALVGNMVQESGLNPAAINAKEGAYGLLQWRLDRLQRLRDMATARGVDPTDTNLQLDFIGEEMRGPEARAGGRFMQTTDLPGAAAALKGYIRWGDNSDATRLANAQSILGGGPVNTAPTSSTTAPGANPAGPAASPGSVGVISEDSARSSFDPSQLAGAFGALAPQFQQQQQQQKPLQHLLIPQAQLPRIDLSKLRAALARPLV